VRSPGKRTGSSLDRMRLILAMLGVCGLIMVAPGQAWAVAAPVLPGDTVTTAGEVYSGVASQLSPEATVDWGDGSPAEGLVVGPGGTATLSHVFVLEGDYVITVTNHEFAEASSSTTHVFVLLPGPTGTAFTGVDPGTTATLTLAGIQGSLTNPSSASTSALFLIATYGQDGTSASYDVRVTSAGAGATLVVVFHYPVGTGFAGLFFLDPATGAQVAVRSNTFVVDPVAHTVTVVFDSASFPALAGLTGTRFVATGRPQPPRIESLRLRPGCVQAARSSSLRVSLAEAAHVDVAIARKKGSRGRTRCGSHRRAGHRRRAHFERPRRLSRELSAGTSEIRLPRLTAGAYRVRVTASNANGQSSATRKLLILS
jgi:hypothetical protein